MTLLSMQCMFSNKISLPSALVLELEFEEVANANLSSIIDNVLIVTKEDYSLNLCNTYEQADLIPVSLIFPHGTVTSLGIFWCALGSGAAIP